MTCRQDAQQTLMAFDWPGNVRQLENVIERTFALSPGRAQLTAPICPMKSATVGPSCQSEPRLSFPITGIEMERLVSRLRAHAHPARARARPGGNKRQAADLLHVKRTTLIEKLKRLER